MDSNPWDNAWVDDKHPWSNNTTKTTTTTTATATTSRDDEADLAAPSWGTTTQLGWPDPDPHSNPIWSPDPVSQPWNHVSPYDSFAFAKKTPVEDTEERNVDIVHDSPEVAHEQPPPALTIQIPEEDDDNDNDKEEEEQYEQDTIETKASSTVSPSLHTCPSTPATPTTPGSPDGFGGFESGVQATTTTPSIDPWTPAVSAFETGWEESPSWESEQPDASPAEPVIDEWEAARIQKERQDRVVPPEKLQAILDQFASLCPELYPAQDTNTNNDTNTSHRAGLDAVPGMDDLSARFVPNDLSLTPIKPFSQSFSAKGMVEAVKLTRNTPFTRFSPLNQYMATKGSTAWEMSVKSRPAAVTDDTDVIPIGWRILDKKPEAVVEQETAKRPSGGLLSFFSKRSSVQSTPVATPRSQSPRPTSLRNSTSVTSLASPRSSTDIPPRSTSSSTKPSSPVSTTSIPAPVPVAAAPSMASAHSTTSSIDIFPPASSDPSEDFEPPPPSAVSRFFKSFSRAKGRHVSRESAVALSTGDIEYLSEVPSAADDEHGADADVHQLRALESMITSAALPAKLPPPLAPPPRPAAKAPPVQASSPEQKPSPLFDLQPTTSSKPPSPLTVHPPATGSFPLMSVFEDPITPVPQPPPAPLATGVSERPAPPRSLPTTTPVYDFDDDMSIFNMPVSGNRSQSSSIRQTEKVLTKRPSVMAVMSSSSASSSSSSLFTLPPPPGSSRPSSGASRIPTLPPPSSSHNIPRIASPPPAPAQVQSPVQQMTPSLFDDDDFAGFQTSSQPISQSSIAASNSTASSTNQLISSTHKTTPSIGFDDFDDFVDATATTNNEPSTHLGSFVGAGTLSILAAVPPPTPPTKLSRPISPPVAARTPPTPPNKDAHHQHHRRTSSSRVSASEHKRTQSLLDAAAGRNGQWLGPPTPIPEAIPPPPGQSLKTKAPLGGTAGGRGGTGGLLDLNGDDDEDNRPLGQFGMQQQAAMRSLSPPPPSQTKTSAPFTGGSFTFPAVMSSSTPLKLPPDNGPKQGKSGLSAQDLSFFEGL